MFSEWGVSKACFRWCKILAWYGCPFACFHKYLQYLMVWIRSVIDGIHPCGLVCKFWHCCLAQSIPWIHSVSMLSSLVLIFLIRLDSLVTSFEMVCVLLRRSCWVMWFSRWSRYFLTILGSCVFSLHTLAMMIASIVVPNMFISGMLIHKHWWSPIVLSPLRYLHELLWITWVVKIPSIGFCPWFWVGGASCPCVVSIALLIPNLAKKAVMSGFWMSLLASILRMIWSPCVVQSCNNGLKLV